MAGNNHKLSCTTSECHDYICQDGCSKNQMAKTHRPDFFNSCVFFFFCLFCYTICSVVIDIFAASPPSWKPSDFNVRLCLALLEFSLYRYNSFLPSNTLPHSALSPLLPACRSCLLWAIFCSGRPSVGLPRSDLLHSG